jgi:ubiquinol-cytochrome c reductase cytochrome b subunit
VLCLLGGLFQINPVWLFGPFDPAQVSAASQPDWYMGWLDGALRIMPGYEIRLWGFEVPNPFFPGAGLGGLTFLLLYAGPFIEARATGDHAEHHVLDLPRQRPLRTSLGVATLSFYLVLFLGAASDVIASTFEVSVNRVLITLRVLVIAVPILAGMIAYRLCKELSARDGLPIAPTLKERRKASA